MHEGIIHWLIMNGLCSGIAAGLFQIRCRYLYEYGTQKLLQKDSAVVGVEAISEGNKIVFEARRGIVLATGGFARNVEMRMHYDQSLTGDMLCSNAPGSNGDGILMAEKLGANLIGMEYIELYPMGDVYDGDIKKFHS